MLNKVKNIIASSFKRFTVDGEFIVAFDYTGVYVFTVSDNYEDTLFEFRILKEDLVLEDNEVTLCYVGSTGEQYINHTTIEGLENWIINNISCKPKVFTKEDIDELDNCYEIEIEEYNSKVSIMREYNLTDEQIHYVLNHTINSIKQLEKIGVNREDATQVFHFLQRVNNMDINTTDESGIKIGVSVYLTEYARKYAMLSVLWCMICAAALYAAISYLRIDVQIIGIIMLVLESFSIFCASISIRSDDLAVAKISVVLTAILMLITVISCYGQNILSLINI